MSKKLIKQTWTIENKAGKKTEISFTVKDNEVITEVSYGGKKLVLDALETKSLRAIFEDTKYIFTSQNLK